MLSFALKFQGSKVGLDFLFLLPRVKRQDAIDVKARDQTERQSVMSTAVYLLMEVELLKEAKELALTELKKSKAPYYFMSYLAAIEKKLGQETQSLKWSREAWLKSSGHATRFQWGTSYLLSALKVNPQGTSEMQADMGVIFDEILLQKDALEGRNKRRFERLLKELKASAVGTALFEQKCNQSTHATECQALIKGLKS